MSYIFSSTTTVVGNRIEDKPTSLILKYHRLAHRHNTLVSIGGGRAEGVFVAKRK